MLEARPCAPCEGPAAFGMGKPLRTTPLPANVRVLHLTYLGRSYLGFDLAPALRQALDAGRITPEVHADVTQRLLWLRTKHECLAIAARRVRDGWMQVRQTAITRDPGLDRYTLNVGQSEAVELVADVEGFVTVMHSMLEVAVELAQLVERDVLRLPRKARTPVEQFRALPGVTAEERELLWGVRGGFVHSQASWLAVVLQPDGPVDLAILTRDRPDFTAGEGYVLLSRVDAWFQALQHHVDELERALAERIAPAG